MPRAIFLDRDGTLNYDRKDYVKSLAEFQLFSFTGEALRRLQDSGFKLIIISNQSALARGLITRQELQRIHGAMQQDLTARSVTLDGIYWCPHHPDENCLCRKPGTANIEQAAAEHDIDLARSYFIGDSWRDIETGARAGCKTVLVLSGIRNVPPEAAQQWRSAPDYIVDNLLTAAKLIDEIERESQVQ